MDFNNVIRSIVYLNCISYKIYHYQTYVFHLNVESNFELIND